MLRGDSSHYARFKESEETAHATNHKDGNIELVGNECSSNDIERQDPSPKVLAAAVRKIYVCLLAICIAVAVLLVFTATNFVLIMKSRNQVLMRQQSTPSDLKNTKTQYHLEVRDELDLSSSDPLAQDFDTNPHPCEVYIADSCYWLSKSDGENFKNAVKTCEDNGGEAGVVYSDIYEIILKYIRQYSTDDITSAWLGMTRDSQSGEIRLVNRSKVEDALQHWIPKYPSMDTGATNLCLRVDKNISSTNTGFLNLDPKSIDKTQGILCEMPWQDGGHDDYDYTTDSTPTNSTKY